MMKLATLAELFLSVNIAKVNKAGDYIFNNLEYEPYNVKL